MFPKWRYDYVQRRLSKRFYSYGKYVGGHPTPFLVIPLLVTAALAVGLVNMEEETDIEYLFTPANSRAVRDRDLVDRLFPRGDSDDFVAGKQSRVGHYGQIIITATDGRSVLRAGILREISNIHKMVTELMIEDGAGGAGGGNLNYRDLCGKLSGSCYEAPVLTLYNTYNASDITLNLTYPVHTVDILNQTHRIFLGSSLGGVTLSADGETIKTARAMQLNYFLEDGISGSDGRRIVQNERWESMFLEALRSFSSLDVEISYFTSQSLEKEVAELSVRGVPRIASITLALVLTFSVSCCLVTDCVRSKPWLGVLGVLSPGLAVMSSFGVMSYLGVPYINICASMPLLILGIGVDDMFILLAAWRQTPSQCPVEERMGRAFSEAAMSITVTSVTDFLALAIGTVSTFPSVRIFCLYTAAAVLFDYAYQITFFAACMAFTGRREAANLHCLTFKKVSLADDGAEASRNEEHFMVRFFRKYYGPFITDKRVKVFVVLGFIAYLHVALAGMFRIEEGLQMQNLVADDSYAGHFYNAYYDHFRVYGPAVSLVLAGTINYSNNYIQEEIENTLRSFEQSEYFHDNRLVTQSWLRDYLDFLSSNSIDCHDRECFINNLNDPFLRVFAQYRPDVVFNREKTEIVTSRFTVFSRNMTDTNRERNMMHEARRIAREARLGFFVYSPSFVFYEQYTAIVPNTVQNICICVFAMFLVSLILIPHPICSLYITFFVSTITLGVIGFMGFLGIRLDSIAMITMIICIGFSVDFSAHMTCAFILSPQQPRNQRAIEALHILGWPILEGAISTFLGIVALSTADSYGYRTFFKIMFLVITIGAAHGVVFLPVFLTIFGPVNPVKKISVAREVAVYEEHGIDSCGPERPKEFSFPEARRKTEEFMNKQASSVEKHIMQNEKEALTVY